MIKIFPVAKSNPATLAFIKDKVIQRQVKQASGSVLPTVFVAVDEETQETSALGFKYRRQSHHCEIIWWEGTNEKLFTELAKALVMQAILEGRKRVEIFNETKSALSRYDWPGEKLNKALEEAGFQSEGSHKFWTKDLEDVDVYGYLWMSEGIPVLLPETEVTLVSSGEYRIDEDGKEHGWGVQFYRAKNLELYKKDRDLYRQKEGDDKNFSEHIAAAISAVSTNPQVILDDEWVGSPRKA